MIIYHEGHRNEARTTQRELNTRLDIPSRLVAGDLAPVVHYTPNSNIYTPKEHDMTKILPAVHRVPTLVYTNRDLYDPDEKFDANNTWLYADKRGRNLFVVSSARLKGIDSAKPRQKLHKDVPADHYMKRIVTSAFTILGERIIRGENGPAPHFQPSFYVNELANDGKGLRENLDPHCPNPDCIMYPVIDFRAPTNGYEYLLLGSEKRFDAGNEEQLERLMPDWFCDDCRNSMRIEEKYYRVA